MLIRQTSLWSYRSLENKESLGYHIHQIIMKYQPVTDSEIQVLLEKQQGILLPRSTISARRNELIKKYNVCICPVDEVKDECTNRTVKAWGC